MLQVVKKYFCETLSLLLLCGCDKVDFKGFIMPTGDVVNSRFEQSLNMHSGNPLASVAAAESYTFYVCTDPHVSDGSKNIKTFATLLRGDDAASFGVVLGDCIDKRGSMPLYRDAIAFDAEVQQCDKPVFSAIGNHDLYFSGWDDFKKFIGPSVYYFEVTHTSGKDVFIILDSASGTHGHKQLEWLRKFLSAHRNEYRHCVVVTHTNMFYSDNSQAFSGNIPIDETIMLLNLFREHKVTLCLQGHDHFREDFVFAGVRYTVVGTIRDEVENPEYLCITLSNEGVRYDWKLLK